MWGRSAGGDFLHLRRRRRGWCCSLNHRGRLWLPRFSNNGRASLLRAPRHRAPSVARSSSRSGADRCGRGGILSYLYDLGNLGGRVDGSIGRRVGRGVLAFVAMVAPCTAAAAAENSAEGERDKGSHDENVGEAVFVVGWVVPMVGDFPFAPGYWAGGEGQQLVEEVACGCIEVWEIMGEVERVTTLIQMETYSTSSGQSNASPDAPGPPGSDASSQARQFA